MSDLVSFLKARLDEDEAAAEAALKYGQWSDKPWYSGEIHIARHSPARAFRQAEAMRSILDDLPAYGRQRRDLRDHMYLPENAAYHSGHADGTDDAARWVLRQLAAVYSDHPDYDPAWTPETAKPPPAGGDGRGRLKRSRERV